MSTWTCRPVAAFVLCASLTQAGCDVAGGQGSASALTSLAVSNGGITVIGPRGYCVDRAASRDSASGAFVLMGSCASIAGARSAPAPRSPALLTAAVTDGGSGLVRSLDNLEGFFRSDAGRRALSRVGDADSVQVLETSVEGGAIFLRLSDRSDVAGRAVEPEYWRAVLPLNGRIVALSALGLVDRPLGAAQKRRALDAFIDRMRRENPTILPPQPTEQPDPGLQKANGNG